MGSKPRRQPELFTPGDMAPTLIARACLTRAGDVYCGTGCNRRLGCRACGWLRGHLKVVLFHPNPEKLFSLAFHHIWAAGDLLQRLKKGGFPTDTVEQILRENREITQKLAPWKPIAYRCRLDAVATLTRSLIVKEYRPIDGRWYTHLNTYIDYVCDKPQLLMGLLGRACSLSGLRADRPGGSASDFTSDDLETYWAELGERFTRCDWRPKEMLPEDHYA